MLNQREEFILPDNIKNNKNADALLAEFESDNTDIELIRSLCSEPDEDEAPIDLDEQWERIKLLALESEPIYDLEEDNITHMSEAKAKRKRPARKLLVAVAAVVVVLCGVSIAANANGGSLKNAVANWTEDVFGFSPHIDIKDFADPEPVIPEALTKLAEEFDKYGISRDKLPKYIPEGYEEYETDFADLVDAIILTTALKKGDSMSIVQYFLSVGGEKTPEYQKDDVEPEIYSVSLNDKTIDFYITTNAGDYFAVWQDGMLEGSLFNFDSRDELLKVIDSIYD